MARRVSAAEAKAQLPALMASVAYGSERVLIERRGKPLAALVSVDDLERLEREQAVSARPRGALALVGLWRDVGDEQIDALVAHIYAEREKDTGRPVELDD
ncbi:MAG: type II toxin-antitoxin system Phd/YefM family antitoxin [Chloroflexi bacterium]|nr:type II toxin-antitoxin system Phd/YefM family antitoxin [Chloroflexota bacterium]